MDQGRGRVGWQSRVLRRSARNRRGKRRAAPSFLPKPQRRMGHPNLSRRLCAGSQANRNSPTFGSRWIRSASGRGLEPLDRSAPRGRLSAAHGCLQPHRYAVPCNCPATGTAFLGFRWGNRWYFRRRKPVGAGTCEGPFGGGNRRGTLADRACERQLQKCPDLLLGRSNCFQDFARKPNTGCQEAKLNEKVSQRIPIALYPSGEFAHGLTLITPWTGIRFNLQPGSAGGNW